MEDYNRIYPEVPKEAPKDKIYPEAPKDGKTFRLQQSCRVLENLEKEAKHYASVRKKYKRCLNVLSRISTSSGTLSFCLSGSGVQTDFFGVGLPLAASLGGLGIVCGVASVIAGEAGKKVSRKATKHEKTVSVCESKINSLKDRISKALADDRLSDEEFENILAEMEKYHEMKKDIRLEFQKKTRSKKRWILSEPGLRQNYADRFMQKYSKNWHSKKTAENRSKLFLFSQKRRFVC